SRIAIEPRPYQLVPLLMALRQDTIRLLIADDVGIGKTVEACLIARELLDRGEIRRMAVLCPPHLAEQWQRALTDQFHIDAALVLPSTAARLERDCGPGESLFDRHAHVVVSTDYIKAEKRRHEFLRACPEFVIVDEAHGCAAPVGPGRYRQQRHDLLEGLSRDEDRHIVLVTATPHSGNEAAFRSLLGLLSPNFIELPEDLSGDKNRKVREELARYFVQRRRADLQEYMGTETPFPAQEAAEDSYTLKPEYRKLFDKFLAYCRERVVEPGATAHRQRVKWWSALAMLRALGSSPAAAAATLVNRAMAADTETLEEADAVGGRAVLDLDDEATEGIDVVPGSQVDEDEASSDRKRLLELMREVVDLAGDQDAKLVHATKLVKELLDDGFAPILFCRFIPTAEYVANHLRQKLKGVAVQAITGKLTPEEREERVADLAANDRRVLVCTDCLSEGINLQESFDAVMHYDLSWNPTRHEQREGRVDRYGQPNPVVRTITFYGQDNPVDGFVLDVLLRKHKRIRSQLGITVPVPMDTSVIVEAIFQGLLLRKKAEPQQLLLDFAEDPARKQMDIQWDAVAEREKKTRNLFAQHQMQKAVGDDLVAELTETRRALGSGQDVERFTTEVLTSFGVAISKKKNTHAISLQGAPAALRDAVGEDEGLTICFGPPVPKGAKLVTRTHPVIEGLSALVLEGALDAALPGPARRCGVIRTGAVSKRTTLLLLRLRYHLIAEGGADPILAEDLALVGFEGSPEEAIWLPEDAVLPLLDAQPGANVPAEPAREQLQRLMEAVPALRPHLHKVAEDRGRDLLIAHKRVRGAARISMRGIKVEPHLPVDLLGAFVYLPVPKGGAS
ncbi:MAG: DEAD/DEAH box helicase, partial [Proteobacteria bacterium]|nr:DEAD/DEAH box helicase [Pseudomonadota bacterium]